MTKPFLSGSRIAAVAGVILLSGCIVKDDTAKKTAADSAALAASAVRDTTDISVPAYDSVSADTVGLGSQISQMADTASLPTDSVLTNVTLKVIGAKPAAFPLRIPPRGATPLQLQILLDRANFSPGIIDGTWGGNAAKALQWFRVANGLDSAGSVSDSSAVPTTSGNTIKGRPSTATLSKAAIDKATYDKLVGSTDMSSLITSYQVSGDDVKGPFVDIPNSVYDQAKLTCLCYSSPGEQLAEKFHTSEQLLHQLNPAVDLKTVSAGTSIQVPNVEPFQAGSTASAPSSASPATAGSAQIAKLIISRKGFWTHAVDSAGKIVDHFPSTLGAGYDPSPSGDFHVTGISQNPAFHYQPSLMAEVPDSRPTARLKPGPNSPVGAVWMALSKPHYGIHGTSSPQTIGYANSHGCVRLTNWDAEKLSLLIRAGTPVEFQ